MTNTTEKGTRLAKVLAMCGVASRRQAEVLIQTGHITVNGKTTTEVTTFVDIDKDVITVDRKPVTMPDRLRVWLYYKPAGVITTHRDPEGRPTVFDEAKRAGLPHVISVGRLDLNSEGLILLTNQGSFAHHAENPKTAWKRCYRVRVFGEQLPVNDLLKLKDGITIDGYHYGQIDVDIDINARNGRNPQGYNPRGHNPKGLNHWLMMTLTEGKNREIRNVMNHLGLEVNRLIRLSYGPFELGALKPGMIKEVPGKQLKNPVWD